MSRQDLAFVACRLFALYWFISALGFTYALVGFLTAWGSDASGLGAGSYDASFLYVQSLPFFIYLAMACVLWVWAEKIAALIAPAADTAKRSAGLSFVEGQAIAFAAVGLFILCTALPDVGGVLYDFHVKSQRVTGLTIPFDTKANIVQLSLQIALGLLLLFGARGLSGLVLWFRELGMKTKTPNKRP